MLVLRLDSQFVSQHVFLDVLIAGSLHSLRKHSFSPILLSFLPVSHQHSLSRMQPQTHGPLVHASKVPGPICFVLDGKY
jgi:hypothetical protein